MDSILQTLEREREKKIKTNRRRDALGPEFSYTEGVKKMALFYSRPVEDRRAARRSLVGSEVPRELALFTAVEGGVVEEGAGGAVPMRPLVLLNLTI